MTPTLPSPLKSKSGRKTALEVVAFMNARADLAAAAGAKCYVLLRSSSVWGRPFAEVFYAKGAAKFGSLRLTTRGTCDLIQDAAFVLVGGSSMVGYTYEVPALEIVRALSGPAFVLGARGSK